MPDDILRFAIPAMWLAWLLYWILAAGNVKANRWRESGSSRASVAIPGLIAAILLSRHTRIVPVLNQHFVPPSLLLAPLGTIAVAAGLGFAVWARVHLGRNWSATVTVKEDHALIRTGPYRYVRHPIYTGMLLALAGTALAIGEWRGVLAVALVLLAFWRKISLEEQRMRDTFPEYDDYRRTTSALIPFIF
jgi:protein-S-isoprenylcysteine O-methyltransferase Ste14